LSEAVPEFTGERIIPGSVDVNLLNEHLARYAFAAENAQEKRVLDAGCGSGYGAAIIATVAREVVGIDRADEAIEYARAHYVAANLHFERGGCDALPASDASFDVITAFEVIEHLQGWREFLRESRRVLAPRGLFLVSTPNKEYYAESRRVAGPNPFHVHEFTLEEFQLELASVFPFVELFAQNHVEAIAFTPLARVAQASACVRVSACVQASAAAVDDSAHFFVAVCGMNPLPPRGPFVYVPNAGNLLWQRERHITLLENEIRLKTDWIERTTTELAALNRQFASQNEELERNNRWAQGLNEEMARRDLRIQELQSEVAMQQEDFRATAAEYESKLEELQRENVAKTEWALDNERRLEERTLWAQRLQQEADGLRQQLSMVRQSRWLKLGRKFGIGPVLPQ
jgi:ubiquinone/menaquinone biosynthesis C-methylase UbiE